METTSAQQSITVRICKAQFRDGLKLVKSAHGRYNPSPQTWTIPAVMVEYLRFVGSLELVAGEAPTFNRNGEPLRFATPIAARIDPRNPVCPRCHTYCDGDCRS